MRKNFSEVMSIFRALLPFLYPYRFYLLLPLVAMGGVSAIQSGIPLLIRKVMDRVFVEKNSTALLSLSLLILFLFAVKGVLSYLGNFLIGVIGNRIVLSIRQRLVERLLSEELTFFARYHRGDLLSRLFYDTAYTQNALTRALTGFFLHILTILGLLSVAFYLHPALTGIALVGFPLAFYPIYRFGEMMRDFVQRGQKEMGETQSRFLETLQGIRVVKIFSLEEKALKTLQEHLVQFYRVFVKIVKVQSLAPPVIEWIGALAGVLVLILGGRDVLSGKWSPGSFFAFLSSVFLLYDPLRKLNASWQEIQQGVASGERILPILTDLSEESGKRSEREEKGPLEPLRFSKTISFRGVSFRYPEGGEVLKKIDLDIEKGKKIAIVGASGSGKSTFLDLIPRFYDPVEGAIYWDGKDIRTIPLSSLRKSIAMVDQHPVLFMGTVLENIWMGNPSASLQEVYRCSKIAGVDLFLKELPRGYETFLGEQGSRLSGGQKQRIAIARALLKGSPILLLDEATSALDPEIERVILLRILEEFPDLTVLFTTHRLSLTRFADEVVVFHKGEVVEVGTPHQLFQQKGLYAHYLQFGKVDFS